MNWILSHLQVVIAVAAAIAYWINQQRAAARGVKEDDPETTRRFETAQPNAEEAERTRRIQEEIRRKIAERSSGPPRPAPAPMTSARPPAPPVIAPRPIAKELPPSLRARLEAKLAEARARTEAATRDRQRRLAERDKALETEQLATQRRMEELAAQVQKNSAPTASTGARIPGEVKSRLDELRDSASLRRAIILREVLGPPVGLR